MSCLNCVELASLLQLRAGCLFFPRRTHSIPLFLTKLVVLVVVVVVVVVVVAVVVVVVVG